MRIHINWSGCKDWDEARSRLQFLGVTLYGNFADLCGTPSAVKSKLKRRGFTIWTQKTHPEGIIFHLSDGEAEC